VLSHKLNNDFFSGGASDERKSTDELMDMSQL